mmetsp:Transcript_82020/g.144868  ORF Transcript_82020/g.144868 Transcript_82020/m.144868 type:complete len:266 (+) Transcript_82020:416-1213(+)
MLLRSASARCSSISRPSSRPVTPSESRETSKTLLSRCWRCTVRTFSSSRSSRTLRTREDSCFCRVSTCSIRCSMRSLPGVRGEGGADEDRWGLRSARRVHRMHSSRSCCCSWARAFSRSRRCCSSASTSSCSSSLWACPCPRPLAMALASSEGSSAMALASNRASSRVKLRGSPSPALLGLNRAAEGVWALGPGVTLCGRASGDATFPRASPWLTLAFRITSFASCTCLTVCCTSSVSCGSLKCGRRTSLGPRLLGVSSSSYPRR